MLSAEDILSFGFEHVALATGSRWRADSVGRFNLRPIQIAAEASVFTPDDLMDGKSPGGRVVIYDDDHYYMASVLAELLLHAGASVMIVTPSSMVSNFAQLTLEQKFIQRRLLEAGAVLKLSHGLCGVGKDHVKLACIYTGRPAEVEADAVIMVTARLPNENLYRQMNARESEWAEHGVRTVTAIGDCLAPGTIAHAVYSGHRFGRELEEPVPATDISYRREVTQLARDYPRVFP
jgi:dimethylamine/trimethylamine dehydrogenase